MSNLVSSGKMRTWVLTGSRAAAGCALVVGSLSVAGCCSSPPVVSAAASSGEDVKLVYTDPCTGEQGLLDCRLDAAGEIRDCRRLKLVFKD